MTLKTTRRFQNQTEIMTLIAICAHLLILLQGVVWGGGGALFTGWGCIYWICWEFLWPPLVEHTGVLAGTMVLLGAAGLDRDYCSTECNILLDDGPLCRRVSPDGWCWWVDCCVLLMDVCWGVLVGLLGMASGYSWELSFCLRLHYTFFQFLLVMKYIVLCVLVLRCECKV